LRSRWSALEDRCCSFPPDFVRKSDEKFLFEIRKIGSEYGYKVGEGNPSASEKNYWEPPETQIPIKLYIGKKKKAEVLSLLSAPGTRREGGWLPKIIPLKVGWITPDDLSRKIEKAAIKRKAVFELAKSGDEKSIGFLQANFKLKIFSGEEIKNYEPSVERKFKTKIRITDLGSDVLVVGKYGLEYTDRKPREVEDAELEDEIEETREEEEVEDQEGEEVEGEPTALEKIDIVSPKGEIESLKRGHILNSFKIYKEYFDDDNEERNRVFRQKLTKTSETENRLIDALDSEGRAHGKRKTR